MSAQPILIPSDVAEALRQMARVLTFWHQKIEREIKIEKGDLQESIAALPDLYDESSPWSVNLCADESATLSESLMNAGELAMWLSDWDVAALHQGKQESQRRKPRRSGAVSVGR